MTAQRTIERSAMVLKSCPLLIDALFHVGHQQTRNRGTIGGSLCHLDPVGGIAGDRLRAGCCADGGKQDWPSQDRVCGFSGGLSDDEPRTGRNPGADRIRRMPAACRIGLRGICSPAGRFRHRLDARRCWRWTKATLSRRTRLAAGGIAPVPARLTSHRGDARGRTRERGVDRARRGGRCGFPCRRRRDESCRIPPGACRPSHAAR